MGLTAAGSESAAALPAGTETSAQRCVSGSLSASFEAEPSSCAGLPLITDWSGPASATGRLLSVVTVTVSGALSKVPSLTISWKI